jgi:T5SS/PEP-CTERM-associated repeat protein/autotransporter-associated beta strand protein
VVVVVPGANAQTQWTAKMGDDWTDPMNWDGGVPYLGLWTIVGHGPDPKMPADAFTGQFQLGGATLLLEKVGSDPPQRLTSLGYVRIYPDGNALLVGGIWEQTLHDNFDIQGEARLSQGGQLITALPRVGLGVDTFAQVFVSDPGTVWDSTRADNGADSKTLILGYDAPARLEIFDGGTVLSANVTTSGSETAPALAIVRGAGSTWNAARPSGGRFGEFRLGNNGPGELRVLDGASLNTVNLWIGSDPKGVGTALFSGAGTSVSAGAASSGDLIVGGFGKGTLDVLAGAKVYSYNGFIGVQRYEDENDPGVRAHNGTAEISGPGSEWTLGLSTQFNSGDLSVGRNGKGSLLLLAGGAVKARRYYIGGNTNWTATTTTGGEGSVVVSGTGSSMAGSTVSSPNAFVGTDGKGSLTITLGASAKFGTLAVGEGPNPRAQGSVSVSLGGSLTTSQIRLGNIATGPLGGATLNISTGATVTSSAAIIGNDATGIGEARATVTGPGTTWTSGAIQVGASGLGRLTITDGAVVTNTTSNAASIGPSSHALVTGAGSVWTAGQLTVGGFLDVENGAAFGTGTAVLNQNALVNLTGVGSTWNASNLTISSANPITPTFNMGAGTALNIFGRLQLATAVADKALLTQTGGTLTLGTTPTTTNGSFRFGPGTSTYTFEGGTLSVRDTGSGSGRQRGLQADPAASYTFDLAGGRIRATGNLEAAVTATLRPNTTSTLDNNGFSVTWSGNITGDGALVKTGPGTLFLTGTATNTGGLDVTGGTLEITDFSRLAPPTGINLGLVNSSLVIRSEGGVSTATLAQLESLLDSAYANGAWTGPGIGFAPGADTTGLATLGYGFVGSKLIAKYTYNGDADLDGLVDPDDYTLLDRARAMNASPSWTTGDFNYDNTIDAADYLLIDRSFALQGGPLSPAFLAGREAQFGADYVAGLLTSIPEPALAAFPLTASLVGRRRRHR